MPLFSRLSASSLALALFLYSTALLAAVGDEAFQALRLLDAISADYRLAGDGRPAMDDLVAAQKWVDALPEHSERENLSQGLAALRQSIEQHRDEATVTRQARLLSAKLAAAYEISQTPVITPDPTRGAALYDQHCSVCHGETGTGDGPAGLDLTPPPGNLRDAARLDRMSLFDLYNTLLVGIDGTDMPAFADQLDERQRWDVAAYIAGFSVPAGLSTGGNPYDLADLSRRTPAEVRAEEGAEAAARYRAQRAQPPQARRGPEQLLDYTGSMLDKSLAAFTAGDHEQAYDLSVAAYLEGFELVESPLDNVDTDVRKSTEKALMGYRQALQDGLPLAQVTQKLETAKAGLAASAKLLGGEGLSRSLSFISGFLILLREGLEAILVLAAILAFLRNTGQQAAIRSVNVGWGLALLAGLGTWALAAYVIDVSGAQRELLEGCTALFASVMVLWLGVWMHDRRHAAAWQDYIKSSLVSGGGRFGFAVLAFFSVYRELFEVILFYETLWLQAGPAGHEAVLAGAVTALVVLIGLAWVILRGSARLPLALFFSINAGLLCALSVVFAGHGVKALQEAGVFGTHPVKFFDFDWLGIHADGYSLAAQVIALTVIVILYERSRRAEKRRLQGA